jgi:hypothetical protein
MRNVVILALLGCQLCFAQAPDECRPSTLKIPGAKYPCVYPDGRATFRVVASGAQKVQVMVGEPTDTNTADNPFHIVPKDFVINDASSTWTHTFPGNSITVIRFKTTGASS